MTPTGVLQRPWAPGRPRERNRWLQLVASAAAVMAVAAVLFAWPLLRSAPDAGLGASLAATENAFAAFIMAETFFVPLEGRLGDRAGRGVLVALGAALVVLGALAGAQTGAGRAQLAWYALGGVGGGLVYGGTMAKVLKRFTDRKALCMGVTAAACAGVVALALGAGVVARGAPEALPILILLGAGQAAIVLIAALFILDPPPGDRLPPGD